MRPRKPFLQPFLLTYAGTAKAKVKTLSTRACVVPPVGLPASAKRKNLKGPAMPDRLAELDRMIRSDRRHLERPGLYNPARTAGWQHRPHPCQTCPSRDSRDPPHARGCPALQQPSKAELMALARACEAYWAGKRARAAGG